MKISVFVKTNSRVESVELSEDGGYIVRIRVAPEGGKANERVCELFAEYFERPKTAVRIATGHKSKKKILNIE